MNNLYIIYGRYYDFRNDSITIGGVQTYISNLIEVASALFDRLVLLQMGEEEKDIRLEKVSIKQFSSASQSAFENNVYEWIKANDDILKCTVLFATDSIIFRKKLFPKSIAIQHGISWDIPKPDSKRGLRRTILSKALSAYRTIESLNKVKSVVCVDYNFQNWYRSLTAKGSEKLIVIPNFTEIGPIFEKPVDKIKIIFARRLFPYRGTRVFTEAIIKILEEYRSVEVTIAGDGPDEGYMHEHLDRFDSVTFTRYSSNESLSIHADKHIAVVPTVGSEGTSLSLLEAMSAQCAVICTDVGGMTNVVLDRYNGLIVKAGDAISLYEAIKKLIIDEELRKQIAENAYRTVINSFSREIWKEKWNNVLEHY